MRYGFANDELLLHRAAELKDSARRHEYLQESLASLRTLAVPRNSPLPTEASLGIHGGERIFQVGALLEPLKGLEKPTAAEFARFRSSWSTLLANSRKICTAAGGQILFAALRREPDLQRAADPKTGACCLRGCFDELLHRQSEFIFDQLERTQVLAESLAADFYSRKLRQASIISFYASDLALEFMLHKNLVSLSAHTPFDQLAAQILSLSAEHDALYEGLVETKTRR